MEVSFQVIDFDNNIPLENTYNDAYSEEAGITIQEDYTLAVAKYARAHCLRRFLLARV